MRKSSGAVLPAASERHTASNRRKRNEKKEEASPIVRILRGALIGILTGAVLGGLLLLIVSGVVASRSDPDAVLYPAALSLLFVVSILSGLIAARVSGVSTLPIGGTTAACWILLTVLLSLTIGDGSGAFPSVYAWALRIPQALFVLFGAFLGKSRPRKGGSRRRR